MQFLSFVASTVDNTPSTCRSSFQKDNEFVHAHPPETFALLSRGGERTLTSRAKIALILGAIALGIVLAMIIYTFAIAELYYGGVENMARQVYGTLGIDFDTLMNSLGQ